MVTGGVAILFTDRRYRWRQSWWLRAFSCWSRWYWSWPRSVAVSTWLPCIDHRRHCRTVSLLVSFVLVSLTTLMSCWHITRRLIAICGDLNCAGEVDGLDSLLDDLLTSRQLVQPVHEPTHRDGNVLDVVITLETSTLCGKLTVADPGISDHKLIVANLNVSRLKPQVRIINYRKIKSRHCCVRQPTK